MKRVSNLHDILGSPSDSVSEMWDDLESAVKKKKVSVAIGVRNILGVERLLKRCSGGPLGTIINLTFLSQVVRWQLDCGVGGFQDQMSHAIIVGMPQAIGWLVYVI